MRASTVEDIGPRPTGRRHAALDSIEVRDNLAWMRERLSGQERQGRHPTRIVARGRKLEEWDLEHTEMSAVFDLLPLD